MTPATKAAAYSAPVLTLGQIRDTAPCVEVWHALLDGLGQPHVGFDSTIEVTLGDVARINGAAWDALSGVEDALWCLRCLPVEKARYWAHALVSPTVERAQQYTEAPTRSARAAKSAQAATEAKDAAGASLLAVEAAWAARLAVTRTEEELLAQFADIIRLCPPLHQPAGSEVAP